MNAEGSHVARPRRWVGPTVLLVVFLTPIVILVASNTDSSAIAWAGFEWQAPRWLILTVTFVAGAIGGRLFGWAWRSWRRRRRRLADELDVLRRHAAEPEA